MSKLCLEKNNDKPYAQSADLDITIWLDGALYNTPDVLSLYRECGDEFVKYLDGDFALVLQDLRNNILIVSADVFATRPLWIAGADDEIEAFYIYASKLKESNYENIRKVPPNTAYVVDANGGKITKEITLYDFSLRQYRRTYDYWLEAFAEAIRKRVPRGKKLFIGLSSGYDSGAIACELKRQEVPFRAYSLLASEKEETIKARQRFHSDFRFLQMTESDYWQHKTKICAECEDYEGSVRLYVGQKSLAHRTKNYNYKEDKASVGLSYICNMAKSDGFLIDFSGQGADEIISDYGHAGKKIYSHSQFGGLFPDDLKKRFPYHSFFAGTQDCYLTKTAYVGRIYGIETRYPFLDVDLVQEFLHLHADLKNRNYKAPLHEYLTQNNYPFDVRTKRGFQANQNLLSDYKVVEYSREITDFIESTVAEAKA